MTDRPAKRQRRSTRINTDQDEDRTASTLPLRSPKSQRQLELDQGNGTSFTLSPSGSKTAKVKGSPSKATLKASPKPSPDKRKNSQQQPDKSKSLHSFFGKATEDQRWRKKSATPDIDIHDDELGEDIEDDLSDNGLLEMEDSKKTLDRRKPVVNGVSKLNGGPPSSSQRFVKPVLPSRRDSSDPLPQQEYHRPWSDRYGPTNLEELAVHKKKVADVSSWLQNVLSGRDKYKVLLLRGPAGSGKSTTISLLSKSLGFDIVSWQNPTSYEASTSGSVLSQFDEFLDRGGQFGSLAFRDSMTTSVHSTSSDQVLLVEEFPAAGTRSVGLDGVRGVVLQLLARAQAMAAPPFRDQSTSAGKSPPVVMIVSETLLSSSTAFSDSFTAHRLLGPAILNHPLVTVMDFNPVAPTFVHKALDLVVKKEARQSGRRRMPGAAVLQRLAEMGDVRNAVNTLEFLCVRNEADWSGTVASKTKKSAKEKQAMTEMEKDSLQLVCQRETTLDMFHAAGKIVYNKREDPLVQDTRAEPPPKPPDHLMHLYTPKASQVDIEALLSETGTDIRTFISTVHENYILSCNGDSFADSFEGCADTLSISDILSPDSRPSIRTRTGNAATSPANISSSSSDALRQDEISFHVTTRGLLFNLPHPVNRATPPSGRQSDRFKMFYPASLRLWKPTEETESLISLHTHDDALSPTTSSTTTGAIEGVASWKSSTFGATHPSTDLDDSDLEPRKTTLSHHELTLHVLPYLTQIKTARKQETRTLSKITKFNGSVVQMVESEPDDEQPKEDLIVTRDMSRQVAPGSTNLGEAQGKRDEQLKMERLYLEDDDIVDD